MLYKDVTDVICKNRVIKNKSKEVFLQDIYRSMRAFDGVIFEKDTIYEKWCKGLAPISKDIVERIYLNKEDFAELSDALKREFLSISNDTGVVCSLTSLIDGSTMLTRKSKDLLLSIYKDNDPQAFADFLATCLLVSNICTLRKSDDAYPLDIHFDFLNIKPSIPKQNIATKIWNASLNNYRTSHEYGNRFYALNVVEKLLPKGSLDDRKRNLYSFEFKVRLKENDIKRVDQLIAESQNNIALTGVGGIGKTSCLQKMLYDKFGEPNAENTPVYHYGQQIPFFIELNKCPLNITDWFDPMLQKTNFITRYIAASIEGHMTLDDVSVDLLKKIEKDFQKKSETGKPTYFLFLDGFNEVHTGHDSNNKSARNALSNEITHLSQYPNIRILTTTRPTQSDIFSKDFDRATLEGLPDEEIISYLQENPNTITEEQIGIILSNKELMKCLRVPLFLCMFATENFVQNFLPETTGEILYNFFHKNESKYNLRRREHDVRTGILDEYDSNFILDFILPYIGWKMFSNDIFSIRNKELKSYITECLSILSSILDSVSDDIPFSDFNYEAYNFKTAFNDLKADQRNNYKAIIDTIHEYISVMYQFDNPMPNARYDEIHQHAFVHHHFRDYFSAIWNVQLLKFMQCFDMDLLFEQFTNSSTTESIGYYVNHKMWSREIAQYVGEVFLESHNKPYYDTQEQFWKLPVPSCDEQHTLTEILDDCRTCCKHNINVEILIHNILDSIYLCREEFSGLNLSGLTLYQSNLFNIQLSRKGELASLSANFTNSKLSKRSLNPTEHLNDVSDYVYVGDYCYTLDTGNVIKVWDIETGSLVDEYHDNVDNGLLDFRPSGYLRVSKNGRWIATLIQPANPQSDGAYILLYDTLSADNQKYNLKSTQHYKNITDFIISDDSDLLYVLFDRKYLCIFQLSDDCKLLAEYTIDNAFKNGRIFESCHKNELYYFTAEYSYIDLENYYDDDEADFDEDDEDFEFLENGYPCNIIRLNFSDKKSSAFSEKCLLSFVSPPNTAPFVFYYKKKDCFIIYNATKSCFEIFDCGSLETRTVFEAINAENPDDVPGMMCSISEDSDDAYIIYSTWGYIASLDENHIHSYTSRFNLDDLRDEDGNPYEEIFFHQAVNPYKDHFILRSGEYTYEWIRSKDIVTLKYNTLYYNCIDFIPDIEHDRSILVHAFNGVNIFSNSEKRMYLSYRNYPLNSCVVSVAYDEHNEILALISESTTSSSEYVTLYNLLTGEQTVIFSSYYKDEMIKSVFFSTEDTLLIVTSKTCYEYDLSIGSSNKIDIYNKNEILICGTYQNNKLHVISYNPKKLENGWSHPLCRIYNKGKNKKYAFESGYYLPVMSLNAAHSFVTAIQDYGNSYWITCDGKEKGQWIAEGFFFEQNEAVNKILTVDAFDNKTARETYKRELPTHEFLYILSDFMLGTESGAVSSKNYQYSYIDNKFENCIMLKNKCILYQYNDLRNNDTAYRIFDYTDPEAYGISNAFFDIVIPTGKKYFFCLGEGYHIYIINSRTGKYEGEIPYDPGVLISGCDFSDTGWLGEGIGHNVNNDFHIHDFILRNGGIMN